MALPEGASLRKDRYRIQKLLAYGGFGFTYLAYDRMAERQVVIKELIPALTEHKQAARRFVREGRTMQRLRHPNMVRTEVTFRDGGNHYIVLEYVAGLALSDWTDRGKKMGLERAATLILTLCDVVSYLHQRGVIHNDLTPSNVFLDAEGQPKLGDLGIAHVSDALVHRSWRTESDFVQGTVFYMAPEQLDGLRADPRVDLYALAAIFYQLLAGRHYLDFNLRHTPGAQAENIRRVQNERPRPIPDVPPEVMNVIRRGLHKDAKASLSRRDDLSARTDSGPDRLLAGPESDAPLGALWIGRRANHLSGKHRVALLDLGRAACCQRCRDAPGGPAADAFSINRVLYNW